MSDDSTQAVVAGKAPLEPGNAAAQVSADAIGQAKPAGMIATEEPGTEIATDAMEVEKSAPAEETAGGEEVMNGTADPATEAPAPDIKPAEQNGRMEEDKAASKEEDTRKNEKRERKDRDDDRSREKDRRREKESKDRHKERDERDTRRDRDDRKRSGDKDRDRDRDSRKRRERSASRDKDRDRERDRDRDRSKSDRKEKRSSRHRSRSRERSRRSSRDKDRKSRHRSRSKERHSSRRRRHKSEVTDSSEDEFGGYVPRKRQEAPRATGYSTAYIDPYAALRSKTLAPADPEELARTMQEQQLKARQLVLQQQAASAVAAASKTQREVYVGNLMAGLVTEDALRQLFNSTMRAAFPAQCPPGMEPVVSVSLHSEGRYAFVELRTPEMASAALQLSNQVQLLGQSISVGRPSGYVDPSRAQEAAAAAAAALQAFQAGDMQTMEAQLQQANLGATSSPAVANASPAVAGQALPGPPAMAVPAPVAAPGPMAPSVEPAAATPYLEVNGMVTPEVLMDDDEYKEVIQDLYEECGKYGQLVSVIVPRPPNPASAMELFGSNNYGKAFAQFTDAGSCTSAKAAIHGRMFAGETIRAQYVTPQYFAQLPR